MPETERAAALLDRATGALAGLALGDALGMPTQSFTREQIRLRFGVLDGLYAGPGDQPIAPRMPAGRITDDTEQALLLADELVTGRGHVDPHRWAAALDAWEQQMVARGSRDLLGPSTSRAIAAIRAGADPTEAGSSGTTNGAAMRVAPVGIAARWGESGCEHERFIDIVEESCLPTHHTGLAIAGAAAVAAAVSAGVEGATYDGVLGAAIEAAARGARRGRARPGPSVAARLEWALRAAPTGAGADVDAWLYDVVGTTVATQESVVAAFVLLADTRADVGGGLLRAASLGGDTDTMAAILGAMSGAMVGQRGLPQGWWAQVADVNRLDVGVVADQLLDLRGEGM